MDRYTVNGEYRQVMLSPRELSYQHLPSRGWINEHLTYTHGYGLVAGPVNRISPEGLPEFFVKDIPPARRRLARRSRGRQIYYGEIGNEYVFVRTKSQELDYPSGDQNVYTRYRAAAAFRSTRCSGSWSSRSGSARSRCSSPTTSRPRAAS